MNITRFNWIDLNQDEEIPSPIYRSSSGNFIHQEYGCFVFPKNTDRYTSLFRAVNVSGNQIWPITAILVIHVLAQAKRLI